MKRNSFVDPYSFFEYLTYLSRMDIGFCAGTGLYKVCIDMSGWCRVDSAAGASADMREFSSNKKRDGAPQRNLSSPSHFFSRSHSLHPEKLSSSHNRFSPSYHRPPTCCHSLVMICLLCPALILSHTLYRAVHSFHSKCVPLVVLSSALCTHRPSTTRGIVCGVRGIPPD